MGDKEQIMESKGRYNWGGTVLTARQMAERGYDRLTRTDFIQPILDGSKPIAAAIYGEQDSGAVVDLTTLMAEPVVSVESAPEAKPARGVIKRHRVVAYPDSRERRRKRRGLRRAQKVYGRGWYLSRGQVKWLATLWAGSCLLLSSLITLAWLTLIERLGLS